jgi:hypothetical protein
MKTETILWIVGGYLVWKFMSGQSQVTANPDTPTSSPGVTFGPPAPTVTLGPVISNTPMITNTQYY